MGHSLAAGAWRKTDLDVYSRVTLDKSHGLIFEPWFLYQYNGDIMLPPYRAVVKIN